MNDSFFEPDLLVYLEGIDAPVEVWFDLTSGGLWSVTLKDQHLGWVDKGAGMVSDALDLLIRKGYDPCGVVHFSDFFRLGFPYDSEGTHVHE